MLFIIYNTERFCSLTHTGVFVVKFSFFFSAYLDFHANCVARTCLVQTKQSDVLETKLIYKSKSIWVGVLYISIVNSQIHIWQSNWEGFLLFFIISVLLELSVSSALGDVFFMCSAIFGITGSNDCGQFPESSLYCYMPWGPGNGVMIVMTHQPGWALLHNKETISVLCVYCAHTSMFHNCMNGGLFDS